MNIFSLFASERYDLTKKITVNVDAQLVRQSYSLSDIKKGNEYMTFLKSDGTMVTADGELFKINYLFFNPRVGLNYLVDDNWTENHYNIGSSFGACSSSVPTTRYNPDRFVRIG